MIGVGTVLSGIDPVLRELHPDADRKRLRLERHAGKDKHLINISCAVPGGEKAGVRVNLGPGDGDASDRSLLDMKRLQPRTEGDRAAVFLDAITNLRHDHSQRVASQMRFRIDQDVGRRATIDQDPKESADASTILDPRGQFAVGEEPRASFTEESVAFLVQNPTPPERLDVPSARFHRQASLKHPRTKPRFGEHQGRHQSGGTGPDHDGTVAGSDRQHRRMQIRRFRLYDLDLPLRKGDRRDPTVFDIHREDEAWRLFTVTRIQRSADHRDVTEILFSASKPSSGHANDVGFRVIQTNDDLMHSQPHARSRSGPILPVCPHARTRWNLT